MYRWNASKPKIVTYEREQLLANKSKSMQTE